MTPEERINAALAIAYDWGNTDGAHHKQWVISQMVAALTDDGYPEWVAHYCNGDDGPYTYEWDEGIAP